MRQSKWIVLLILLAAMTLAVAFTGCSDGDDTSDGDTPDGDVDGDEDGDVDGDEDGDVDGDEPNCTCDANDDCCDGCNPINAGGACDDGNGCTSGTTCNAGVCEGGEGTTCEALDACHVAGECDPATGECSNPAIEDGTLCDDENPCTLADACLSGACTGTAMDCTAENECQLDGACDTATGECVREFVAPGTYCEAIEGTPGSGACLLGQCGGFGECDTRTYGQPAKFACNVGAECAGGVCARMDAWYTYCSQPCGDDLDACPDGMNCTDEGEPFGKICTMTAREDTLPGEGRLDIYQACNADEDCAGGLCLALGTEKFCTTNCEDVTRGADGAVCGECGQCRDGGIDLGFAFEYYCIPTGDVPNGGACELDLDCDSRVCYNNYCTDQCVDVGGVSTCEDGFTCVPNSAEDILGRDLERNFAMCVLTSELEKDFGEGCGFDWHCTTNVCRDVAGENMCVEDCMSEACSQGICTGVREISIDTKMELWADGGETALSANDDGGSNLLSKIPYTFETAGTYYIKVEGYGSTTEGYYGLFAGLADAEPTEVAEAETNDTQDAAQALTLPAKVNAYLTAGEVDWFSITIAEGDVPVSLVMETTTVWEMLCLPDDMVQSEGYGDACTEPFQCEDGLTCRSGFCTNECESDTDCPDGFCFDFGTGGMWCVPDNQAGSTADGETCSYDWQCRETCWPDSLIEQFYCTGACDSDDDCSDGMGCYGGQCVMGLGGGQYPYSICRIDIDCDTGFCDNGYCSATCQTAEDCEGGTAFDPAQYETCWPCDPNNGNADCNDGGTDGPNLCVSADQGVTNFCGVDCTNDPTVCGEGTRCYQVGWFNSVCAPVTFTCDAGAACNEDGACIRPTRDEGETCSEDIECITGTCENGFCQSATCSADADCGCDYLTCQSDYCGVDAGDGQLEIEPNNVVADAMSLTGTTVVVSSLMAVDSAPDVDIFSVALDAGQGLDVLTEPFCGNAVDTYIRLLDANGDPIEGWANDDINQSSNFFSILLGYVATEAQTVLIEVTQSAYVSGLLNDYYLLNVSKYTVAANNTCDGATALSEGVNNIDLGDAVHSYGGSGCVQYGAAGKDKAYTLSIPANNLVTLTLQSDFDGQMYLVEDCADIAGTCLMGADSDHLNTGEESLQWYNTSDATVDAILIVDSFMPIADMSATVTVELEEVTPPANDTAAGAQSLGAPGETIEGTLTGASDDYNPTASGCSEEELPGPDVVYSTYLEAGFFLSVRATSAQATLSMYLVTDPSDLSTCVAHGETLLTYSVPNTRNVPNYYLIVDTADVDVYGTFTLQVDFGTPGACKGLCDSTSYAAACVEGDAAGLCQCDATTGTLNTFDCAANCVEGGALDGVCHVFTTPGREGTRCLCEQDCTDVQTQCNDMIYTNCTCAASDPCAWQDDTYCDEYCEYEYYPDYFDDAIDCAPPAK